MHSVDPLWLATATALLALVLTASWSDLRTRRIPNALSMAGLIGALVLRAAAGPDALLAALASAGIAFFLGFALFALGWFGGGDAKLLAAVGAFLEPRALLVALLATALAGGVLALFEAVRHRVILVVLMETGTVLKRWLLAPLRLAGLTGTRAAAFPAAREAASTVLGRPGTMTVPYGLAIGAGAVIGFFFPGSLP